MVMGNLNGRMEGNIKDSGQKVSNMGKEFIQIKMERKFKGCGVKVKK